MKGASMETSPRGAFQMQTIFSTTVLTKLQDIQNSLSNKSALFFNLIKRLLSLFEND